MEYSNWKPVFQTKNQKELLHKKELLDSKGIMAQIRPLDNRFRISNLFNKFTYQILVPESHIQQAQELLSQSH